MLTPRVARLYRATSVCFSISCLIFVFGVLCARADSVSGRVLDPQGNRVAGAKLRLLHRSSGDVRTTVSSDEGDYSFPRIPAGTYLLEAEASSAALSVFKEVAVEGDQRLDLALILSARNVQVIVTASSTPVPVEEVAKAVDVVDLDEITRRDEFSIAESVRNLPGIRVKQLEGPGSLTTIRSRGLRTQDTSVLVDGMRLRDAASTQADATAFLEDMTVVDTDRIEFLRGAGSSLYGTNAIAGVLNISSRPGGGRTRGDFRAEGGGLGIIRSVVTAGGGLSNDRFTYSGGASHLNVTKGVRDGMIYRNSSTQGSVKYAFAPNISLSGRLWWGNGYLATTESPSFTPSILANFPASGPVPAIANVTFIPSRVDPDARRASDFITGLATFQHEISANRSYRISYSGVSTKRTHLDGPAGPGSFEPAFPNRSKFDGRTDTVQARSDQRLGSWNLVTAGYEFEREAYFSFGTDKSPNPPTNSTDLQQHTHAVFAQDQVQLLEGRLQLNLGARAQFFDLRTPTFSGSTQSPYLGVSAKTPDAYTGDGALAYFIPGSRTKLRSHVGNSFRSPSPYERFGSSFSSFARSFSYYGDPRLRPERAIAVDGGIDQWLVGSKVQLSGTYFYTNLQETIIFDFANFPAATDPFKRFGGYRNGGGGIARGLELSSHISPASGTNLRIAYTYTNSDSRTPTIGTSFYQALGLSDHVFALTATQWIKQRFNFTFDLYATSDYSLSPFGAATNGVSRRLVFDGPVKTDVVVSYQFWRTERNIEVYSKIENVFNRHYYEDGFTSPGAWAIAGIRFKL